MCRKRHLTKFFQLAAKPARRTGETKFVGVRYGHHADRKRQHFAGIFATAKFGFNKKLPTPL